MTNSPPCVPVTNTVYVTIISNVPMWAPSTAVIDSWKGMSAATAKTVRDNLIRGGYCR